MSLHGFFKPSAKEQDRIDKGLPAGVNLVDFSQIVLSSIMGTFQPTDKIDEDMIRHIVLNTLRSNVLKNKVKFPKIIICLDNSENGYWRKKVASHYKYKRSKARDDSDYDFEFIFSVMAKVKQEMIDNFPYTIMDLEGVEADDHIGVLTPYYVDQGVPVLITSSDGDFTQLHTSPLVRQWSPMQKKWVKPKHGSAANDLRFKNLKGDKKDGIASIRATSDHYTYDDGRRAPSVTAKMLELWMNTPEEEMFEVLGEDLFLRYKENQKLIDLKFIPNDIQCNILTRCKEYRPAPKSKLFTYFAANKLEKLITNMSDF